VQIVETYLVAFDEKIMELLVYEKMSSWILHH